MIRFLAPLLLVLSLASPAFAAPRGKLIVSTDRPIMVVVDGTPLEYEEGTMAVEAVGLAPGRHVIEFRNAFGKLVSQGEFEVPFEGRSEVRTRWADKRFEVVDTVLLDDGGQVIVVERTTTVVPSETVSVSANMGGVGVSAHAGASAHGSVGVHAEMGADFGVSTGVVVTETHTVTEEVVTTDNRAPRLVTFRVTDDESMNLWIDGQRAWAYHVGNAEKKVELAAGEHHVEVKDFMENETVCTGRLWVDLDLTVGISTDGCLQVFNDSSAFQRTR